MPRNLASSRISGVGFCTDEMSSRCTGNALAIRNAISLFLGLTGRFVGAQEAKAIGLVAQVYPAVSWLQDAKTLAHTIAEKAPVAARLATEAVDLAWNSTLDAGLEFERKAFYLLFATEDKKEGVDAFVNKRKPSFKGR